MLLLTRVSLEITMPFLLCYVGSIDTLFLTTGVGSVRTITEQINTKMDPEKLTSVNIFSPV
jgi:hypothetical protein